MDDKRLEIISLITIIIGLGLCYIFILDFNPEEFTNPEKDYDKTNIKGQLIKIQYDAEKNITKFTLKTQIYINGMINGEIKSDSDFLEFQGSYKNNYFFAETTIKENKYK